MKLLFDENLSRKLVSQLSDLFPESSHVAREGLLRAPDRQIWEHARNYNYAIVTADADFYDLAIRYGPPPKIIWLRKCDYPTTVASHLLRMQAIRVADFLKPDDRAVLILTP